MFPEILLNVFNESVPDSYRLGVNFEFEDQVLDKTRWPKNLTQTFFTQKGLKSQTNIAKNIKTSTANTTTRPIKITKNEDLNLLDQ